jgi:hypothetical protein
MHSFHHIMISRVLAVVTFAMFLVLTPRAWVDPEMRGTTEEVPVDVLEAPSENDCLWCEPKPATDCDDSERTTSPPSRRPWLNPDESIVPLQAPCPADEEADPHA